MIRLSAMLLSCLLIPALYAADIQPNELRLCLRSDPKTFDPLMVDEESGETIRYLTAGVLIRWNRGKQTLEPELATSWKVSDLGRKITFVLRPRLRFSDGSPFGADDVAATINRMMDPAVHSPVGDSFRSGGSGVRVVVETSTRVSVLFPAPVASIDRLFDQVGIVSAHSPKKELAVLGPFSLAEHKAGSYLLLTRNPHYWKRDAAGHQLPYLETIRLYIQNNRDLEMLRFRRGEIHLVAGLDPVAFEQLKLDSPGKAVDAGSTQDNEMVWFNQVKRAPIPDYKKVWFASPVFRRAVSAAINRADIARLVYSGHAKPAVGPFSDTNRTWYNRSLRIQSYSPAESLRMLQQAGFRLTDNQLHDSRGKAVEFSVITNSGNKSRTRMASLVQQDLAKLGIRLNIVPLDFPALIERITRTFAYEACLLGLMNIDPDPNGQMNVWLSSGNNHQWNPQQQSPETPWEAEIDKLMRAQASSLDLDKRRASFNKVQEIIADQLPFIYLIHKNSLAAVDPRVRNIAPVPETPNLLWNAYELRLGDGVLTRK